MQLCLSGFLFEDNYSSQSVDLSGFCGIAKSAGYAGVELRGTQVGPEWLPGERYMLRTMLREQGLFVSCLTARGLPAGGRDRDTFLDRHLGLCADLECGLLKIWSDDRPWLRSAVGRAKAFGVCLAFNNHAGMASATVSGTLEILNGLPHSHFGLLFDASHLMREGEDYVGCIPQVAPRTRNVLVQSIRRLVSSAPTGQSDAWAHALPDEPGVQEWPRIFRAFRRAGYDGQVTVIENGWPAAKREYVARRCAEVIRGMWDTAAGGT
jgi:sugar phosphate isomerase/epimerase